MLRYYAGDEGLKVLGKASSPEEYLSTCHPVVELVDQLVKRQHLKHIFVQSGPLSITLEQRTPSG